MAENKLSWSELRRALAQRAGVSEKEANTFLTAFNAQLVEGLKEEKQVKINGLGTFKLQPVAPRKSVNVTTGEEITIAGYNKIVFSPEAGVKELVEKGIQPSAISYQKSEGIDPIQKLGEQAEEIVDILSELGQSPKESIKEEPKEPAEPVEPVEPIEPKEPEKPIEPIEPKEPEKPIEPKKPKKYHFLRDTLICVVILLMLLFVSYFFLRSQLSGWMDEWLKAKEPTEVSIQDSAVSIQPSEVSYQEEQVNKQPAEESEQPSEERIQPEAAEEWTYDELLLTEEIAEGSRLAWIAKKHYGDKAYWVYLYDANKDRISNPSRIAVGTPIRVPRLNAAMRDTTSARFQQIQARAREAIEN